MVDHALYLDSLRRFAALMSHHYDVSALCYELCDRAAATLEVAGAAVAVVDERGIFAFISVSGEGVKAVEQVEERLQQGPCVTAYHEARTVAVPDIGETDQWPEFAAQTEEMGLPASLGVPLETERGTIGSMDLYDRNPRDWSDEEIETAGGFADMASAALLRDRQLREAADVTRQLQAALDSRVVIEQAKGIIANQRAIRVDEAFEVLRSFARSRQSPLKQVAAAIVEMGLVLPE